jgi:hypothetical protein
MTGTESPRQWIARSKRDVRRGFSVTHVFVPSLTIWTTVGRAPATRYSNADGALVHRRGPQANCPRESEPMSGQASEPGATRRQK